MDDKKPRRGAPFYIDCSDEEPVQSDEEIDVGGLSPLGDDVSQVDSDSAVAAPAITENSILSFSREVARVFLSNFSQENCRTLVEQICANYGYSIFTVDIHGCLDDNFFQDYALRNRYLLTPNFLAQINQLRNEFSHNVDLVSNEENFGRFLFQIPGEDLEYVGRLITRYSAIFSRSSYRARNRLVEVLNSVIIPRLIEIINQHTVIHGSDECVLSYHHREQFFLHVVTTLERLIIVKLMNYWNGFCGVNRGALSLFPDVDFSNPFILARDRSCAVSIPEVNYPVAFNSRWGILISSMASSRLNKVTDDAVSDCVRVLSPVILGMVKKKYSGISSILVLLRFNKETMDSTIDEEFLKVMDECLRGKFINFLNELLIWPQEELSQNVLQNFVRQSIDMVRNLVKVKITNEALDLIKGYKANIRSMTKSKKTASVQQSGQVYRGASFTGKFDISDACGFKISKEFFSTLETIRSKSFKPFRLIAKKVISDTLESGKLTNFDWDYVSEELMDEIIKASKQETDVVYRKVSNAILKARVISEENIERDILPVERTILHKNVMKLLNIRFKNNTPRLWREMSKKYLESGETSSSGVSAAGSNRTSVIVSTGVVSTAATSSAASAVPTSSRDASSQASSSTVRGKSKARKRKRGDTTDVASAEGRTGIVHFEYGPILVREAFNSEISGMVSEHLSYMGRVLDDIREDLEEEGSYTTENMRRQSMEAGENVLSDFMARVREVVRNASVYDDDMKERGIDEDEVSSVAAHIHRIIIIRHGELLDKKLG